MVPETEQGSGLLRQHLGGDGIWDLLNCAEKESHHYVPPPMYLSPYIIKLVSICFADTLGAL